MHVLALRFILETIPSIEIPTNLLTYVLLKMNKVLPLTESKINLPPGC
jgi:hypothetical protein